MSTTTTRTIMTKFLVAKLIILSHFSLSLTSLISLVHHLLNVFKKSTDWFAAYAPLSCTNSEYYVKQYLLSVFCQVQSGMVNC